MRIERPSGPKPIGWRMGTTPELSNLQEQILVDALHLGGKIAGPRPLMMTEGSARTSLVIAAFERILRQPPSEDEMRDAGRGAHGEIERGGIGHPGTVAAGNRMSRRRESSESAGRCRARARP